MTKLRVTWLLLVFLLAGIAGWAGAWIAAQQGLHSPVLPWASLITLSGIGILNLALGIWVFLSKRRKTKTRVAPLAAARIVVLAQFYSLGRRNGRACFYYGYFSARVRQVNPHNACGNARPNCR